MPRQAGSCRLSQTLAVSQRALAMPRIGIGCECGGPEAAIVGELKVPLYQALNRHLTSAHCDAIDEYAIVLRVDGSIQKYGNEGLARLRFAKASRCVSVDVQVPESAWQGLMPAELKAYLARQVKLALTACVARLQKDKHAVADRLLFEEVDAAVAEYLGPAQ